MLPVTSIDDPRLDPYRALKDRELARDGNRFIAEGELVVRRLLGSDYPVESVLLAERRAQRLAPLVPGHVPVYVVPEELLRQIIGYKFQSGVIAVGRRKPQILLEQLPALRNQRVTLVICPETASAQNMGALIRISAAFGIDAMVLGERCCDPFWRQSIRVSMGTIFSLPLVFSTDLVRDLALMREQWGIELAAAVLDDHAEPLKAASRANRLGIVFGNEAQGLDDRIVSLCDRKVTIPMRTGIDSLNVAVAAGIFLHHFTNDA